MMTVRTSRGESRTSVTIDGRPATTAMMSSTSWLTSMFAAPLDPNASHFLSTTTHYTKQVLDESKRQGMDINGVAQGQIGVESRALSKAATARGITFNRLGPKGVIKASF